ncbi:uncharacterized protein LOC129589683 [Paramacrobiotus metropolitanus]|uniref:uncharacterized protein LOC129589683 n=1 Tax=Paramacrobiotus metropolitanus TaxID=2943436 RepID=UPI0024462266|nr:uncharacterized protein LOC129589683 [Paramacrobiotus metropolitanus]
MESVVLSRIRKTPLVPRSYERFAVDVLKDGSTYRGYLCGVKNSQYMVRLGSQEQAQVVLMDNLRIPDYSDWETFSQGTFKEDIDVLISTDEHQPESWQPARVISGVYDGDYLFVTADVYFPGNRVQRCCVLDGKCAGFNRVRRRANVGSYVTLSSFNYIRIPIAPLSLRPSSIITTLEAVQRMPLFPRVFVNGNCRSIMFLGVVDNCVAMLVKERYNNYITIDDTVQVFEDAVERFEKILAKKPEIVVPHILENLFSIIVCQQDFDDPCEFCLGDIYMELHLNVFSYLDIYDQHQLRRTSHRFDQLLSSYALRQCIILPRQHKHVAERLGLMGYYTNYFSSRFILAEILANAVTRNAKLLYLTGNWEKLLATLVNILKVISVKLSWLILSDNSVLKFNDFLVFPKPFPMLRTQDLMHTQINFLLMPDYPDYAPICQRLVLRNCSFNSRLSMCFAGMLLTQNDYMIRPESRSHLGCCYDPFYIRIPCWQYDFTDLDNRKFAAAFRLALTEFCPILECSKGNTLIHWLQSLTDEDLELKKCISPFVQLSYALWDEEPPNSLDGIISDISNRAIPKSLIMQTLALLLPYIQNESTR